MRATRAVRTCVGFETKAAVEALEPRRLLSVSLPRDVNAVGMSAATGNLTDVSGALFFTTEDGTSGLELWKTDGTEAGTVLVKDVRPGGSASNPANLLNLDGTLLFTANDGTSGVELWRSDGTAAGTTLVKDIFAGSSSSTPFGLVRLGDAAYFFAMAGSSASGSSVQLWKTDGTEAGTTRVADVTGPSGYTAALPVVAGGLLYFTYRNTAGAQLWASDGTAGGTLMLKAFTLRPGESVSELTGFNGKLYFSAADTEAGQELWKSDGTPEGTVRVADVAAGEIASAADNFHAAGDKLFFTAGTIDTGYELMTLDAADNLTVIDLTPGSTGSIMLSFAPLDGRLYFSRFQGGVTGIELWSSDGTAGGTGLLVDLNPGTGSGAPTNLTAAGGRLYFFGRDATRIGLWTSDGSAGDATFLGAFASQAASRPQRFTASGGKVFFTASNGTGGVEVWVTDGTPAGTRLTRDVYPFSGTADPRFIGTLGDSLYYFADDGVHGVEVWKSDGTAEGTSLLKDIAGGDVIGMFHNPRGHGHNNLLYFATNFNSANQLWRTDGTEAGTIQLHSGSRRINGYASAQGIVYFTRDSFRELWRTDGTVAGTFRVHTFDAPIYLGPSINGAVYIEGYSTANGQEIWRTNGPAGPVTRVTDMNPGPGDALPQGLTAVGDTLFFFATDGVGEGNKLFKTDTVTGATTLVKDVVPNRDDWYADGIGAAGNLLFFGSGTFTAPGNELWVSDGTPAGTVMVKDLNPNGGSDPSYFIALNDREVVFDAAGRLWKSDGTPSGTMQLADIDPEHSGTSWRSHFVRLGDAVYLTADKANSPQGIWRTDGTPQGTYMVSNLNPGGAGYVGQLAAANGSVLFTADDKVRGQEVWRYVPDPPLRVTEAAFDHAAAVPAPHRLTFRLTAAAAAAPQPGELSLLNLTTNTPVPATDFTRNYDAAARTVTFTFPGLAGGVLPNGNYRALLPAGALADAAGNALGLDHTVEFFVLHGDINRDRFVNGTDFAILAGNFGKRGMTYAQGDLNGDGSVNGSDFAILAGNFGKTLPEVPAAAVAATPTAVRAAPAAPAARRHVAPRPQSPRRLAAKAARRTPMRPAAAPNIGRPNLRRMI